jgi:hypothetical protein
MKIQIDVNGLIVSRTWTGTFSGGDSLADLRIWFLEKLWQPDPNRILPPFEKSMLGVQNKVGDLVRNISTDPNPKDVSRDQQGPFTMTLSAIGNDQWISGLFWKLAKRCFFYPNWDIASPEYIGHHFRHKKMWWSWMYFHFSDWFMVLNSVIICFWSGKIKAEVKNDINHMISMLHAEKNYPTFVSRLAAKIYFRHRPVHDFYLPPMPGDYNQAATDSWLASKEVMGWSYAVKQYYHPKTGNEDIYFFFEPAMKWLFNRVML